MKAINIKSIKNINEVKKSLHNLNSDYNHNKKNCKNSQNILMRKKKEIDIISIWEDSESESLSENTILMRFIDIEEKQNNKTQLNKNENSDNEENNNKDDDCLNFNDTKNKEWINNDNEKMRDSKSINRGKMENITNNKIFDDTNNNIGYGNLTENNLGKDDYLFKIEDYPENNKESTNYFNTIRTKKYLQNNKNKPQFSYEEKVVMAKYNLEKQEQREKKILINMKNILNEKKNTKEKNQIEEQDHKGLLPDENDLNLKEED